ncbi:hypothetical protein ACRRTK_024895 [Alexandromys fortis]
MTWWPETHQDTSEFPTTETRQQLPCLSRDKATASQLAAHLKAHSCPLLNSSLLPLARDLEFLGPAQAEVERPWEKRRYRHRSEPERFLGMGCSAIDV